MKNNYLIPLHLHTALGSFLDSMIKIEDLIEFCKSNDLPGFAITEHGNLYSFYYAYNLCKKNNLKFIPGIEAYMVDKLGEINNNTIIHDKTEKRYHIVILAKNKEGLLQLFKLSYDMCNRYHFYNKPRLTLDMLKPLKDNIIVLTACIAGKLPYMLLKKYPEKEIYSYLEKCCEYFPDFYLEIQPNRLEEQSYVNEKLISLNEKFNIPLVITFDSHYIYKSDFDIHEILLCLQTNKTVNDTKKLSYKYPDYFIYSQEDVYENFNNFHPNINKKYIDKAIENIYEIFSKVNVEIDINIPPLKYIESNINNSTIDKEPNDCKIKNYSINEIEDSNNHKIEENVIDIKKYGTARRKFIPQNELKKYMNKLFSNTEIKIEQLNLFP